MAGKRAKCKCGGVITVPNPSSATGPANDGFWDALDTPRKSVPRQNEFQPTPTHQEAGQSNYASLNTFAMQQIARGVPPQKIYQELLARGVDKDHADRIVRNVAPQSYLERRDNRDIGKKHMRIGGLVFLMGLLSIVGTAFLGVVVCASLLMMLWGLFHFLYGLVVWVTGSR